jgi:glycosyltransferase involved in cell wall biosynthesis
MTDCCDSLPTVSVVMALHNGAAHWERSLGSVFAQTVCVHEVFVVDDGSTDGAAEQIEARYGDRVSVIRRLNGGQSAARNSALDVVTGDLVAFLDQDDYWYPTHIAVCSEPFVNLQVGWAYSDFDEIDSESRMVTRRYLRQARGQEHPKETLLAFLGADLMMLPSASIVRTAAIRQVGGFDESLQGYEDDDLFIRLFRAGWDSAYISDATIQFRVQATSSSAGEAFARSRVRFLDKLIETVEDDARMGRYFVRDVAFPRLLATTQAEYALALSAEDFSRAARLHRTCIELIERFSVPPHQRLKVALMRYPAALRQFLLVFQVLPNPLRHLIGGTLGVRPTYRVVSPRRKRS